MNIELSNLFGILINLCIILFSWIFIIRFYRKIKKIGFAYEYSQTVGNNFVIGATSGLFVFVLVYFFEHVSFSKLYFSSFYDLLMSMLIIIINITFNFSILIALILWIASMLTDVGKK